LYFVFVSFLFFFSLVVHHKFFNFIARVFKLKKTAFDNQKTLPKQKKYAVIRPLLIVFFVIQFLFPWRYLLYPGELFWNEEGYRFSWRVMLIETAGIADFKIVDKNSRKSFYVNNGDFLTTFQEKQMSFQPDFILEYAHHLGDYYRQIGIKNPQVYVDCHVTLNGRLSTRFINPKVDLYREKESFKHKKWIIPFNDEIKIKGL
ncbi:MAG: HTTM domain-containing protein, partial [Polaribacter sp.]